MLFADLAAAPGPHTPTRRATRSALVQQASVAALSLAAFVCAPHSARAEDETSTAAAPQVAEVVVTATRRTEKERDVPVSTSVIDQGEVKTIFTSGGDVRALANTVPSLNIESSNGRTFPRFYVRGYGNTDFNAFASQPVSLVYDDVVQENAALKGFPIFDVSDVEVLRGPQGTLFGRNAPAGVVHVQSARPELGVFAGNYSLSEATYNTANFIGALNVPVNDVVAVRLSLQEQHRDNWVSDPINNTKLEGYDDFAGRLQLLYQPSSDFNALFNIHGRHLNGTARLFRANIIQPGTNDLVAGFDPSKIYIDGKNVQEFGSIGGNARLNWNVGDVSIISITGVEKILNYFTQGDIDGGFGASYESTMGPTVTKPDGTVVGIPFAVETGGGISDHIQLTQELRAQSNYSGPLNWLAGVYFFHESATAPNYDYDQLGNTITDYNIARQKNNAYAVFGSLIYKPTDKWDLRGGLRYTHDHKDFDIIAAVNQTFAQTSAKATGDNLSGDVSATYKVDRDFNVYGRLATGFRAPSFGSPSATVGIQVAKAETNRSAELGFKSFLADRRVKLNADVFYYQVKNQQLTAVGGTDNSTRLLNAKKSEGYGAEAELTAQVTERLLFTVAASYNVTHIKDPTLSVGVCASCTVLDPINAQGNAVIDGNPLPQAPRWTVDPSITYTLPLAGGRELFFNSDLAWRSQINFFLYESKEFSGQPFADLGIRAGVRWGEGRYELAGFCRNCLNQVRLVGGIDFDNLTGMINDPVIAGVQFSGKL